MLFGCNSAQQDDLLNNEELEQNIVSEVNNNSEKYSMLSEEERYYYFEAELACSLLSVENEDDMFAVLANSQNISQKYGFEIEEYEELQTKYTNNTEEKIYEVMLELCPVKLQEAIEQQ